VAQSRRFIQICGCFWSLHPKNQNIQCPVGSNDQYHGNGFAVEVLVGCDHPRIVPIGPVGRWVLAFPIFSAILKFKKINIWSRDCHCGLQLLLCTKCHQNWFTRSASKRPKLLNVQCAVARQRPLPWQPHHGGHIGNVMGCDHPSLVQIGSLLGSYGISNIFQHGGCPPFRILKILICNHVTFIVVLIWCCVPNFIKIGSRVRPPDAHNC